MTSASESGTQHLTEAVAAYRAALQERTEARVPLQWAKTQNNLGVGLTDLGARTHDTNELCEALVDHLSAWQVFLSGRHTTLQSLSRPRKKMCT
jgi:hypothetical protein